jgi:CRISPR/Cas system-associated exonuclease Cas4 (RecB family)
MTRFFSSGAIDFGPWSPSKAGVLKECPLKYIFQYIEKPGIPEEQLASQDNTALVMGSAVHKYAENLTEGKGKTIAAKEAFVEVPQTKKNQLTIRSQKRGVHEFIQRMDKFKAANTVVLDKAELRLAVTPNLDSVDFWDYGCVLRGVLDRLLIIERGGKHHAIALDLKTGRRRPIEEYALQLESYGVLVHSAYDVASVSMAAYFTSTGDLDWYTRKVAKSDINADNPVFTTINGLIEDISPSNYNVGRHCNWCNYKTICEQERDNL